MADQSLNLLFQNQVHESFDILTTTATATTAGLLNPIKSPSSSRKTRNTKSTPKSKNISYTYPTICTPITQIQESTSTLLAARSYAKANRTDLAWEALRSLFVVQGVNGYMPKYRYGANVYNVNVNDYVNIGDDNNDEESYYIPNSTLPSFKMFGPSPPPYSPCNSNNNNNNSTNTNNNNKHKNKNYHTTCYDSNNQYTYVNELNITSSGRYISSTPLHATIILEIFYLSNQSKDDIHQLSFYFNRLFKFHSYWMDHLRRQCIVHDGDGNDEHGNGNDDDNSIKIDLSSCYNVVHPWESFIDIQSTKTWMDILQFQIQEIENKKWQPKYDMMNEFVKNSIHYPRKYNRDDNDDNSGNSTSNNDDVDDDVYRAMMYLFECQKNITQSTMTKTTTMTTAKYESFIISQCGFALLDVSNIAILSKSNEDIIQIGSILKQQHSKYKPSKNDEIIMDGWLSLGHDILNALWNETEGRFLSRLLLFHKDEERGGEREGRYYKNHNFDQYDNGDGNSHGRDNEKDEYDKYHFVHNGSIPVMDENIANLLVSWDTSLESSKFMRSVTAPLLDRDGPNSFNCGSFSIWSHGGCGRSRNGNESKNQNEDYSNSNAIYPLMNYWISIGLLRNNALGIGDYIQKSTIRLMCLASSSLTLSPSSSCDQVSFANTYDVISGTPMTNSSECDLTSTSSAALLYNILVEDKPFHVIPAPPIRNSWIVVLIIAELVVAFGVGLSCLFVSLNLLRRLKATDGTGGGCVGGGGIGGGEYEDSLMEMMLRSSQSTNNFLDGGIESESSNNIQNRIEGGDARNSNGMNIRTSSREGEEYNDTGRPLLNRNIRLDEQEPLHVLAWNYFQSINPFGSSEAPSTPSS